MTNDNNSRDPFLLQTDETFINEYIDKVTDLAKTIECERVSREMSLYVLMNQAPYIVDKLEELKLKGKSFYRGLHFRYHVYETCGYPKPELEGLLGVLNSGEEWKKSLEKPKADIEMIEILHETLWKMTEDRPGAVASREETEKERKDLVFRAFVEGVYKTHIEENESLLHMIISSSDEKYKQPCSDLMEKHFFKDGDLNKALIPFVQEAYDEDQDADDESPALYFVKKAVLYGLAAYGIFALYQGVCNKPKTKVPEQIITTTAAPAPVMR